MPFPLQKAALGVLGWFNLKVLGQNPLQFSDVVMPVVEVGDNYLLQGELATESILGTNAGIGSFGGPPMTISVPAGHVYRILAVGCDFGIAAADNAFATDFFATAAISGTSGLIVSQVTTGAQSPGAGRFGAFYFPRPLVLAGGSSINVTQRSSGALTVAASQHMYLLRQSIDV